MSMTIDYKKVSKETKKYDKLLRRYSKMYRWNSLVPNAKIPDARKMRIKILKEAIYKQAGFREDVRKPNDYKERLKRLKERRCGKK